MSELIKLHVEIMALIGATHLDQFILSLHKQLTQVQDSLNVW
jgi:hypothetical protein